MRHRRTARARGTESAAGRAKTPRQLRVGEELRHAPDFRFELDRSFDHAHRIGELLHSPDVARDLEPTDEAERKE